MNRVQISFQLRPITERWPPVPSERLWADPLGDDRFRIASTPWFIADIAIGDIVTAATRNDEALWAVERVEAGGHITIRVVPRKDGPLGGDAQTIADTLAPLGVVIQGMDGHGILAADVPATADLAAVKARLIAGETELDWHFEEGCISDAWIAA